MKKYMLKKIPRCIGMSLAAAGMIHAPAIMAAEPILEEMVVTAQKRTESLQDVPISVSALSSDNIEQRGVSNAGDLKTAIPSMHGYEAPGSRGNLSLSLRGISAGSPSNLSTDPSVALYLDGVYVGKTVGLAMDVADLERVEVLRGPQGTLYGRNATGGAVGLISKKPTGEFGGKVTTTVGSDQLRGLKGVINLPSMASLSSSIAFNKRKRDHLIDSDSPIQDGFDDIDRQAFKINLQWDPSEKFSANYTYDESDLEEDASSVQLVGLTPTDGNPGPGFSPVSRITNVQGLLANAQGLTMIPGADSRIADRLVPSLKALLKAYAPASSSRPSSEKVDLESYTESESKGHALTLTWFFDDFEIKNITAYRDTETRNVGDFDGIDSSLNANGVGAINDGALAALVGLHAGAETATDTIPGIPNALYPTILNQIYTDIDALGAGHTNQNAFFTYEQLSNELQLVGSADRLDYAVGLYLFEDDGSYSSRKLFAGPVGPLVTTSYDNATSAQALYGQTTYTPAILEDRLSITAGLRYTHEEKEVKYKYLTAGSSFDRAFWAMGMGAPAGFNPANPYQQLPQSTYGLSDDESFNNISGTLTAAYQLTESSSVFLRYATGYRSGGFNGESLSTDILGNPAANKYDEETIKQLELGYKSKLWRQRLQLNASLYHYTFDDAQVSTIGLTPGGAVNTSIVNAASATRTGGELELTALVTPDLLVSFGASFVSGDFDEFEFCGASTNCYYQDGVVINDKFVADHAERSNSPDTTINVAVDWTAARMSFGTLNVYMDASWRSDVSSAALWMSAQSDGDLIVYDAMMFDGYTLVNSRISLDDIEVGDGNLSVALWAKNLLDEEYQTFGINFGSLGIESRQWGSPRTVGLDLSYSF